MHPWPLALSFFKFPLRSSSSRSRSAPEQVISTQHCSVAVGLAANDLLQLYLNAWVAAKKWARRTQKFIFPTLNYFYFLTTFCLSQLTGPAR